MDSWRRRRWELLELSARCVKGGGELGTGNRAAVGTEEEEAGVSGMIRWVLARKGRRKRRGGHETAVASPAR
jgi:hypothetical protein